MPLSSSTQPRKRLHVREVRYEGWQRDDGLFDIEARLTDTKDHDFTLASGVRPKGEPVHDMLARVTIDRHGEVMAIEIESQRVPYPAGCDQPMPEYGKLVGANLMHGFRKRLSDVVGGIKGCTHMTELIAFLPTAAVQTFASLRRDNEPQGERPFQLGRCHALETSTETVRRFYPRWYRCPTSV